MTSIGILMFAAVSSAEVIIYGSTPAAITAAIEAQRGGAKAIIVSPETRIGGMTTGGLGMTDTGSQAAYGGLSLKFYRDIYDYYQKRENWKWQRPEDYAPRGQTYHSGARDSLWLFAPSAALSVLERWEKEYKLDIRRGERIKEVEGPKGRRLEVEVEAGRIKAITCESGNVYEGKIFIDATYEGDLMAAAGVNYFVGREDNAVYGETLSGYQPHPRHGGHQLQARIDPYKIKGDRSSGLLPSVLPYEAVKDRKEGSGDKNLQAYNYRMCLTDVEANRIPFKKPVGYQEELYELLFRNFEAGQKELPRNQALMPDAKTDTNNHSGFSTDFIGENWNWAEASYKEREQIAKAHLIYQQGLMWTLANHPRIPEAVRVEFSKWGTCKDEFLDGPGDGWQTQIYVREARRMIGEYVMTEHNCRRTRVCKRPVAMASYGMDSHNTMRYVGADGFVHNEGDIQDWQAGGVSYGIDYGAIIPKKAECANLLVPVCVSASHMAFGSIRMEPVFFELGQAAGAAAVEAIAEKGTVQDVDYAKLRERLLKAGMYLEVELKGKVEVEVVEIDLAKGCVLEEVVKAARTKAEGTMKRPVIKLVGRDDPIAPLSGMAVWCEESLPSDFVIAGIGERHEGLHRRGVQLVYKHQKGEFFHPDNLPTLTKGAELLNEHGIPFSTIDRPIKLIMGKDVNRLSDPDLNRLLKRPLLFDAEAEACFVKRGFGSIIEKATAFEQIPELKYLNRQELRLGFWAQVKNARKVALEVLTPNSEASMILKVTNFGEERLSEVEVELDPWYQDESKPVKLITIPEQLKVQLL